jgi:hypothetical protein
MIEKDALDERIWNYRKENATIETGSLEQKLLDLNKKRHAAIRLESKTKRVVTKNKWQQRVLSVTRELEALIK